MIKDNLFAIMGALFIIILILGMAALFAFLSGWGFVAFWAYTVAFSFCALLGWMSYPR